MDELVGAGGDSDWLTAVTNMLTMWLLSGQSEEVTLLCWCITGQSVDGNTFCRTTCLCKCWYRIETERLSDGWTWSLQFYSTLCHGCISFLMWSSIGSLGRWALNLGGNDTTSMAEWVSSEVISAEVRLVLLLTMIHHSTIFLSHSLFATQSSHYVAILTLSHCQYLLTCS